LETYQDKFGYIPIDLEINLSIGKVSTLPTFTQTKKDFVKLVRRDGFIYPPIQHLARKTIKGKYRKVPFSERATPLYPLPPTHNVLLDTIINQSDARHDVAGFLIHFLGFLFGYRCQFENWNIDGRIRAISSSDHSHPSSDQTGVIVQKAIDTWRNFLPRQRTVATNLLFLHQRASTVMFEWERFQAEYQVFDAIFALARDTRRLKTKSKIPHEERLKHLCAIYDMPIKIDLIETIVRLRKDLIHEALWDEGMPGEARSSESLYSSIWLNKLSRRLVFAIFGFEGKYISSSWWTLGSYLFDIKPAG
jgi:hypothetical protein